MRLRPQSKPSGRRPQEYLFPKDGGIYVGVDYYPEHWPQERWETDLRMMNEAGFNVVRVAEFSWVLFEPEEGKYEFDWLDRWLKLADKHDIKVIVGTPTAIMPAWLARKYPEALEMKSTGQRTVWGGRRHNCYSDKDYRRLSEGDRPRTCRALRQPSVDRRLANRQRIRQRRLPLRQVPGQLSDAGCRKSTATWPS